MKRRSNPVQKKKRSGKYALKVSEDRQMFGGFCRIWNKKNGYVRGGRS